MIQSLLIANRGEIACRIIRTAKRLGIRTVAVYSDADASALHVRLAAAAVYIGPAMARESYLVGDKLIAAARQTGSDAIHPGYGFLSENAAFAQAVLDAGLIWVGAPPAAIRAMGLKDAAKQRMSDANVPVTPGYLGDDQSAARLQHEADAIGYPVLIKAVAGGGGKGMRRVDAAGQFADALESCRREAAAAFGDERVLLEKYITRPRHIEVQVFGDTYGNVVHLFERDCSLQRRHQKVIEEAPAPGMDQATRAVLCAAAVRAAKAVDYVGAGTIEFIADASEGLRADRIWFMEMNTRLQVEHPVTEAITGQDLVEWQLRIASGEPLPKCQDELSINGWAMEARLYAEDPVTGFLPSIGPLERFNLPAGIRVDTGIDETSEITPYYDPMIAKLITWANSRGEAARLLSQAAAQVDIWPVKTNAAFLSRAAGDEAFLAADIDTGFIERYAARLIPSATPSPAVLQAAAALLLHNILASAASSVWRGAAGFRLNAPPRQVIDLEHDGTAYTVELGAAPDSSLKAEAVSGGCYVNDQGQSFVLRRAIPRGRGAGGNARDGAILSPMPGRIIAIEVAEGDEVKKGQKLLVLEAMKMELALIAPFPGKVIKLNAVLATQVPEGVILAHIEADS